MTTDDEEVTDADIKEWFRKRKERFNENKIRMKIKDEEFSKNDVPARASWVAMFSSAMFFYLEEMYELLEVLYLELIEKETKTSDYDEVKKLLKKHEPTLKRIDSAFAQTDKWIEEGK